ncbi:MAG: polyprenyl synthetase family protein [Ignavibacteria bacterium]|nr:polyprenyl synthetase family protein [Ignavibacteria bacterium]
MKDRELKNFIEPIKEELKEFEKYFSQQMRSRVGLVELIVRYILRQKGKKIRPTLVLLSAKTLGDVNIHTYRGAVLVELLHTATLVHDDVVDNSDTRRGLPSINAIWKNRIAVLMGDYLLARGLQIAVDNDEFDFLKIITNTVKRMSEGELLQIQKIRKLNNDEETYLKIISDKTASLFATCTSIGAMSITSDKNVIDDFRQFGEYLGIAFQIKDDILDFEGTSSIMGKPTGNDLRDKKLTLPIIYALKQAEKNEVKNIKNLIKGRLSSKDIDSIFEFVSRYNGLEYANQRAKEFASKAIDIISKYENSESRQALIELVNFILNRKN